MTRVASITPGIFDKWRMCFKMAFDTGRYVTVCVMVTRKARGISMRAKTLTHFGCLINMAAIAIQNQFCKF